MVRWKHSWQGAIRGVPRNAIRPGSRGDLPVQPVWRFALEKARLHGGKVPDGPSGIYSRTTGSSHALKIPHAQGGCRSGRTSRIARSIGELRMAGIAPLHAPPTARLYIQRNLLHRVRGSRLL